MKNSMWKISILLLGIMFSAAVYAQTTPPEPFGTIPTKHQIDWQKLEYYLFMHFGPNTFNDVEWGDGKEDPKSFNPTALDCRQWAATAKAAGAKGIIITAKHHDGFCLWPSQYSTHTVRESLWKDGKGDVLRELSDACKEYGLLFGVYLSPWDRNHAAYGTAEYNQVFANTLNEVLSNYGKVFEQWFDGANGEGANGRKQEYNWDLFHETVYRNQPHAIIFSDVGPGCRWMGNERGVAGETNWATMNIEGFEPGSKAPAGAILNTGEQGGKAWVPAETDVSIRPGWFYSPSTDDKVKSVAKLMDIYYTSVGRNSNLLLNVPPDRCGRIHPIDSVRLMEFREAREKDFHHNLIDGAKAKASSTRGKLSKYAATNVLNDNYDSYWATNDNELNPYLEIEWRKVQTFNRLQLQEYIPLGQRVASFTVKYWDSKTKNWKELMQATTIGYKRILRFPSVTTQKLRIEFNALACPLINGIGIYKAPEQLSTPAVSRNKEGLVSILCETPDPAIYYTLDGREPSNTSVRYDKPFSLPEGGVVKAVAIADNTRKSETIMVTYDVAPAKWKIVSPAIGTARNAIDGNENSAATIGVNDALVIDLGGSHVLKGFSYTPRARVQAPNIYRYDFYVSMDGEQWEQLKNNAEFDNIANNPIEQKVLFDKTVAARYIKIKSLETVGNREQYVVAEIGIITK